MKSLVWLSTPLSSLPSNRQGESNEICINQPAAGGAAAVNRLRTACRTGRRRRWRNNKSHQPHKMGNQPL
ncbi:TPA: hypothetical protein MIX72_25585, partial [Klebsiella pneumoniae]|nr:hypothetical protein [Klebsiella pneumoniae]